MNCLNLSSATALAVFVTAALRADSAGPVEIPYATVTNPPPLRMLVPGFTARELPLGLNNINNLAYSPDGRLFALCYDGNVFQLKDTDGDGLEDTATYFFKNEHNEIPASIGMTWGPGGLYIASQRRIIRLRDKGDGTGELETIASGWPPMTIAAGSSLDAVGIAVDAKGNVFFGLGCDGWSNPYLPNKETGKSAYDIHSVRGTIVKLSPDWKQRESICTGLRFTVSLALNANGDLFCTDQEGATWLANGNPFDELLHIQPGRHYGFPPRHPKYLPNVIDEPSLFDYAPQHQSTCGLHFNEPVAGGAAVFGPAWWQGDALVSGESRGKLWRTKLVKTAAGYVAQNNLIACLGMLTIDSVPTPQGDVLVTCHSGKPDWGTGPQGKGKLFKISYTDKIAPQPVLAYAASPTETRIVFDRPLDPTQFKNLTKQSTITMGRYVTAGDRFESFRPGYKAVEDQLKLPRFALRVLSAGITADNRSLVLQTAPRTEAVNYALTIPLFSAIPAQATGPENTIDLLSDLTGVEATWRDASGKNTWSGWLPHLDLAAAREFTAASAEHARLFELLKKTGKLTLRARLDLWLMLHPAIQPGQKLDYEYPPETVTIVLKSEGRLNLKSDSRASIKRVSNHEARITAPSTQNNWVPLEITLATGASEPRLEVSWFTEEDPRPRPLPLRRILLPWAAPKAAESPETFNRHVPEMAGGDWQRGRKIFFSEPASCSKCHQVGGEGGKIGPDLSNLTQRDYASVLKDIIEPSAAINPDHLAYNVELKDGDAVTGVILENTEENVVLGQITGQNITVARHRIASMKPSSVSLMPEGLLTHLSAQQQRDLFTFLLTAQPENKK
ncbi:MAG TPA: c-type cytochrome [Verrucomicrobiae bacterium]|nr:c-type cytochrome [Verrucomicrobiae bacterium]